MVNTHSLERIMHNLLCNLRYFSPLWNKKRVYALGSSIMFDTVMLHTIYIMNMIIILWFGVLSLLEYIISWCWCCLFRGEYCLPWYLCDITQQDYYGRRCGTLLHSFCTRAWTKVTVLVLWSSSSTTLEYSRRYSNRVAGWVFQGNSRVTSQEQHCSFSVGTTTVNV